MSTEVTSLLRISSLPLPRYTPILLRTEIIGEHGVCETTIGLTKEMAEKLILLSNDRTDIGLSYTDDQTRFASQATYEAWFDKGRLPVILVQKSTKMLMAMLWFGEKIPPSPIGDGGPNITFVTIAYRSYPPFRGTGFMTTWTSSVLEQFIQANPHCMLWAEIEKTNGGSLHLAKKLGFVEIESDRTSHKALLHLP